MATLGASDMTVRTGALIYGAIAAVVAALALILFVGGDSLAAIKLLLIGGLAPGIALCAWWWSWWLIRRPEWWPERVANVALLVGWVMLILPVLIYIPWAPSGFALHEMPFGLGVISAAGLPLFVGGAIGGVVLRVARAWRERDMGRFGAGLVLLGMIALLVGAAVLGRASGAP